MKIQKKSIRILLSVFFSVFALLSVYPLFWMLLNSFKDTNEIVTGDSFKLPAIWKFQNYTDALFERNIMKYFFNSVLVTGLTLFLTVGVSIMLSYALTRMRWKWSKKVGKIVTLGILLPSQIVIVPVFMMIRSLHLVNNPMSLVLTISAFNIAISTMMCNSFLSAIPLEMEEAAVIDGAGLFSILTRIILPMIRPVIATMCVNVFINSWNEFIYALVLIGSESFRTLPIALMTYSSGKYGTDYGGMYAAMVITSLLPILLFVFFSRQVEKTFSAATLLK